MIFGTGPDGRTWPDITDHLRIDPSVYISPQAVVNGTVTIGPDSSVWPMSVIRGDEGAIVIGARCNIQDGSILHADPAFYLTLGDEVSLGHGAIVHGATIADHVLIGMGAVVLNGAQIGSGSIVAARALVTEGMVVPPGSLVKGIPGRVAQLSPELRDRIRRTTEHYVALKALYQQRERG